MDVRERVGLNLQRRRREKGLSQEELADLASIHQTYLSGVERGKRRLPRIAHIARSDQCAGCQLEMGYLAAYRVFATPWDRHRFLVS
jgi:transcriptional regulator with XRE-family HTH domain